MKIRPRVIFCCTLIKMQQDYELRRFPRHHAPDEEPGDAAEDMELSGSDRAGGAEESGSEGSEPEGAEGAEGSDESDEEEEEEEDGAPTLDDKKVLKMRVLKLLEAEEAIKDLNSKRKVFADEKNDQKSGIIDWMTTFDVRNLAFSDDQQFVLTERKTPGPLNKTTLHEGLVKFFAAEGYEEAEGAAAAKRVYDFLIESLGVRESTLLIKARIPKKKEAGKAGGRAGGGAGGKAQAK